MRHISCGLSAALVSLLFAKTVIAWEFRNIEGSGAGTLNACAATEVYRDAFITIRLYGDDMDIVFQNDEFALPFDEALGIVGITIDTAEYAGLAFSMGKNSYEDRPTTSAMQIHLRKEDYSDLFDLLRNGRALYLTFPSGDAYTIPLRGSARALNMAAECWTRKETGPDEKNPFAVPEKNNPFNTTEPESKNPFEKDT